MITNRCLVKEDFNIFEYFKINDAQRKYLLDRIKKPKKRRLPCDRNCIKCKSLTC